MRLRRSDLSAPGLTRRGRGSGFSYHRPDGSPADPADVERIRALAVPPAWRDVWICSWPNGHIQAVGTDDAGRRQYIYHQDWRRRRDEAKYDRVLELAPALPKFRRAVARQLAGPGWPRSRTLAVALRMLDHGVFRSGGEEYAETNGTYGVATLLREHVRVSREQIAFDYTAKGGSERSITLADRPLADAVAALKRVRSDSDRLLVYREAKTIRHADAADLNQRFKEMVGEEYSVKDLRTWNATVIAATALAGQPEPASKRATRRAEMAVLRQVAEHLGNTPAVARKSYVDPRLFDLYENGVTIAPALRRLGSADLASDRVRQSVEQAVLEALTD
jgi:DNA topoisomerase IB